MRAFEHISVTNSIISMIEVTLKYGLSKVLSNISVESGTTVGSLLQSFTMALSLPESVDALINGRIVDTDYSPVNGDVIVFEKRACSKA